MRRRYRRSSSSVADAAHAVHPVYSSVVNATPATLDKLAFGRVRDALADRAATAFGVERTRAVAPTLTRASVERLHGLVAEVVGGGDLSLGGIADIRPLVERVRDGNLLEGSEILEIAYTLDTATEIKQTILRSGRTKLGEIAASMGSFDGVLRVVREQLDVDGSVRDDATPKLREIRRKLNPLRGRIREKLQRLLDQYSEFVQDPIITLRRDRYVIPIKASSQSRVPGIALDASDSGATVFLEPQPVVAMNNDLAMLEFEERDEVRRILIALGQRVAHAPGLDDTLACIAELDLVNASARLAQDWELVRPTFNDDGRLILHDARHPLIEGCVPNSVELDGEHRMLVVTGPNAGGKTVFIKTVGLAAAMAHSGLFVATSDETAPELPFLDAVMTDIGDEQSIEASLSTYAGHLTNLKAIVERAGGRTLVLIDELGSGTDPDEGAALSQAILERVLETGARALVTTHLAPLKVFASERDGVRNAAMTFDVERLVPTFEMVVGQPGRSYALAIAERLGLPDKLLDRASDILGPAGERLESLLETLEKQRDRLAEELSEAESAQRTAREEADVLRAQIAKLREQEEQVLAAAADKADDILQDTLERAKELKKTATTDPEQRSQALEQIRALRKEAQQQAAKAKPEPSAPKELYRPGTVVRVTEYDAEGPIVEVRDDDVVVQLGLLKVEVAKHETEIVSQPEEKVSKQVKAHIGSAGFDEELNLRGERVEAGIEKLRDYLLEAHALKVPSVRIVHGKGTGALRDAVRSYLKDEKRVERYEDAVPYEGGHGVTVAYLRSA